MAPVKVLIVGQRSVAEPIAAGLCAVRRYDVSVHDPHRGALPACPLPWARVVGVETGRDPSLRWWLRRWCSGAGVAWLRVGVSGMCVLSGPLEESGRPGCCDCADARGTEPHGPASRSGTAAVQPALELSGEGWSAVSMLVLSELNQRWARCAGRSPTDILRLDRSSRRITHHHFLPYDYCPRCAGALAEHARPGDVASLLDQRSGGSGHRAGPGPESDDQAQLARLLETYVDPEMGIIRRLSHRELPHAVLSVADYLSPVTETRRSGAGMTDNAVRSCLAAICESLERLAAERPSGERPLIKASYTEVRDQALCPESLGLYPSTRYMLPGFRCQPFDPGQPLTWVWGYSAAEKRQILVPVTYAYYKAPASFPAEPVLAYETSNGCAVGRSLAEAVLRGALEVAERDGLLMTWHARLPVAAVALDTVDQTVAELVKVIEARHAGKVWIFDTTMEYGIPAVWVLFVRAYDRQSVHGGTVSAGGADVDQPAAMRRALFELEALLNRPTIQAEADRTRALAMLGCPSEVKSRADHGLLYCSSASLTRFSFVLDSGRVTPARAGDSAHGQNVIELMRWAIDRYLFAGLDVIIVDLTAPFHRSGGLFCVKVIVPGAMPLTFGHHYRRLHGLPRIASTPARLGYCPNRGQREICEQPHPLV